MGDQESEEIISAFTKKQNEFNVIRQRIDTKPLLEDIQIYLQGSKTILVENEKGEVKSKRIVIGVPKANEHGSQDILSWITNTINSHTVQGYFPVDRSGFSKSYSDFIYNFQVDIGCHLMINLHEFEIHENNYQGIIDNIMNLVVPFMSRLIDNKERESYGETTRSVESNVVKAKNGFGIFSN